MQVMTSKGLQSLPRKLSYWKHRNGNVYQVTSVTNLSDRQKEYPATVNYIGPNGKEWSKTVYDWFEKMTPLTDVVVDWLNKHEGQVLTLELCAEFQTLWQSIMQEATDGE